jgi:hypothetical protein
MKTIKDISKQIPLYLAVGGKEIWSPIDVSKWFSVETVFNDKISGAISFFIGFSAVVAVALMVFSGYTFITAAGDPDKIEKAQKGITAAIVGMLVVFIASALVSFVIKLITNTGV